MRACVVLLVLVAGCFSPSYPENLECGADSWCPPGQECGANNVCFAATSVDGAGVFDAGMGPDGLNDGRSGLGDLIGISIGDDVTIAVDATHPFPLIGLYENGTQPIGEFAIWESSSTTVFFIDFQGVATGEGAGTATATARYMGRVDSAEVTVTP